MNHDRNAMSGTKLASPTYLSFSKRTVLSVFSMAVLGCIVSFGCIGLYSDGLRRTQLAYLIAFVFVLSLSLGSLFFLLVQHLMRAGWAVMIRRPSEIFSVNIFTVVILSLPILWSVHSGSNSMYPWARTPVLESSEVMDHFSPTQSDDPRSHLYVHQEFDSLTQSKTDWLNPTAFSLRLLFYFAVWSLVSVFYFRASRRLDETGDPRNTLQMERWAGPSIFAFALTLTFAAFDLLMSLDPHWYSTIFGVYYFAGCAVGGFSICLLSWLVLSKQGKMPVGVSPSHLRDLARLLFAFIFFWGYIAFSQYMLLWYANIPETTRWWAVRGASQADGLRSSWGIVLLLLLFGHFVIPFLGLMSRHVKDCRPAMIIGTAWMLLMHYIDLYWLVMPEFRGSIVFGLPEIGTMMFVVGIYLIGASYFATRTSLIPIGDPRALASLMLHDAY